jgi:hypothetical protein
MAKIDRIPNSTSGSSPSDPKPLSEVLGDHVEFDPQDTLVLSGEIMPPVIEDSEDPEGEDGEADERSNFYKPELTLELPGDLIVVINAPTVADIKRAEDKAPNSQVESNYELVAACCVQWGDQPEMPPFARIKAKHLAALGNEMLKFANVWMKDAEAQGFEVLEQPNGDIHHQIKLRDGKVAVFREPLGPDLKLMEGSSNLANKKFVQVASALCIKWGERKGVAIPQLDRVFAWDFYLIQNAIQSFLS